MEALISGRAGLALVVDGSQFASIHAAEPERMVRRQPAEFRYLVGGARDFVPFENVTREEIVRELLLAEDREDALQLILIAQDPDLPDDIRREALEELEEVIREYDVGSYLENVLYAHPLPDCLDLAGAMRQARSAEAWETLALLELLWTHQDAISEVRQAWDSIPLAEFSGQDDYWQATAVRQGLFRDLSRQMANGGSVNHLFVDFETRPALSTLPNHCSVLHRWLDILFRRSTTSAEIKVEGGFSVVREPEEARVATEVHERAERLEATVETLERDLEARHRIVGVSRSWKEVLEQVGRVAPSEATVLVTGEWGTGKEVVSHLVHQGSPRAGKPFVAIDCAALPEQLLESELFGNERGAFTAAPANIGLLEHAAGGTLFLNEIGEMSPLVQVKLLRVLQEREFRRLGGSRTLRADVRVIAATNRDLAAATARGQFRKDLYYRLNVFEIRIPPLRERRDDILPLAEVFLKELGAAMGRPAAGISRDARERLLAYSWPGNVRELRNVIERAILLCDGGMIARKHLPAVVGHPKTAQTSGFNGSFDPASPLPPDGVDLDEVERTRFKKALD